MSNNKTRSAWHGVVHLQRDVHVRTHALFVCETLHLLIPSIHGFSLHRHVGCSNKNDKTGIQTNTEHLKSQSENRDFLFFFFYRSHPWKNHWIRFTPHHFLIFCDFLSFFSSFSRKAAPAAPSLPAVTFFDSTSLINSVSVISADRLSKKNCIILGFVTLIVCCSFLSEGLGADVCQMGSSSPAWE